VTLENHLVLDGDGLVFDERAVPRDPWDHSCIETVYFWSAEYGGVGYAIFTTFVEGYLVFWPRSRSRVYDYRDFRDAPAACVAHFGFHRCPLISCRSHGQFVFTDDETVARGCSQVEYVVSRRCVEPP